MSWPGWNQQQWALAQPSNPLTAPVNTTLPVTNSIPVNPSQYTAEQWASLQQQNWQQWMQWQQQYQQWQQQYGDQFQKSLNTLTVQPAVATPVMPSINPIVTQASVSTTTQNQQLQNISYQQNTTTIPPPLPPESKPPPPPETPTQSTAVFHQQYTQPPPNFLSQSSNFNKSIQNQSLVQNVPPSTINHKPENQSSQSQPPSLLSLKFDKPPFINKRKYPDDNSECKEDSVPEKHFRTNSSQWSTLSETKSDPPIQAKSNTIDLSEAEKNFDEQFKSWEEEFNKWKEQNANHPDKQQYKEYEAKWETWRNQLIEKREQMRRKRLGLPITKPITNPIVPPTLIHKESITSNSKVSDTSTVLLNCDENVTKPTYTDPPKEQRQKRNSISKSDSDHSTTNYEFMSITEKKSIPGLDLVEDAIKCSNLPTTEINRPPPDLEALSRGLNSILGDEKLMDIISKVSQQSMLNYNPKDVQTNSSFSASQPKKDFQWQPSNLTNIAKSSNFEENILDKSEQMNFNHNLSRGQNQNFNNNRNSGEINQDKEQFEFQGRNMFQNNFDNSKSNINTGYGPRNDSFSPNQNYNRNQQQNNVNNTFNNQQRRPPFNNERNFNTSGPNQIADTNSSREDSFEGNMFPMSCNDNGANNNFQQDLRTNRNRDSFIPNRNMNNNRNDFLMQDQQDNRFSLNKNVNPNFNTNTQNKPPALLDLPIIKPQNESVTRRNVTNGNLVDQFKNESTFESDFILTPVTVVDYDHKPLSRQDEDIIFIEPVRTFDYGHKPMHQLNTHASLNSPYNSNSVHKEIRRRQDFSREELNQTRLIKLPSNMRRRNFSERNDSNKDFEQYYNRTVNSERREKSFGYDKLFHDKSNINQINFPPKEEKKNLFPISESASSNCSYPIRRKESENIIGTEPFSAVDVRTSNIRSSKNNVHSVTLIEDILNMPGRTIRPPRIVIILRGPPGSGKTYLAKLIKDKEASQGGSARILSLEDYFMVEVENETVDKETKRKIKTKEMVYEYEESMEKAYLSSLTKAFKKTINDGYFSFIIVDCVNDKINQYEDMWSFAKQNGFQVYVCQMELDVAMCSKKNIHGRTESEIAAMVENWEPTPSHHIILDSTGLLQAASISEVEMDEVSDDDNIPDIKEDDEELSNESDGFKSKWEIMEHTFDKLARLDGTNKPLRPSAQSMEDYLQLDDSIINKETKPGQKKVRWADLVEKQEQEKMRAIGFVVGQTDWNRMMDPSQGSNALTQTKFIESIRKW